MTQLQVGPVSFFHSYLSLLLVTLTGWEADHLAGSNPGMTDFAAEV